MNHGQYFLAEKLVGLIHQNFGGFHPGYRDVHAVARYYAATFTATPEAKNISRAVHFQGEPIPVTVRHSISVSGNPFGRVGLPSMALKFFLPNGTLTDLISLQVPLFPARSPEEVAELLEEIKPDVPNGDPNIEKLKAFYATRPWMEYAFKQIAALPAPLSLAQTEFHAVHAFRFVNAADEATHARYHIEPVAGVAGQTKEELLSHPPSYLYEELEARLRVAPVEFDVILQIAAEGDSLVDPSAPWPEDRTRVNIGRLTVTRPTTIEEIGDPVMLHDPTRLTDGIEATDDPVLSARRGIYEVSVANRTGGWKGRQASLNLAGGCPFAAM